MCGFAGVIAWDEKYRVTRDTLEKMSRAIAHRGPDGEGFHLTRENEPITQDNPQVGLAFRRLAILDPDPRSNQPFHIGPLTLVFNGEIYNFLELKSEISKLKPDYQWRTTGDTEVLLMAYDLWREKCVEKLNGMFAFAVWDEQKKELFLARDRMGQKPLYMQKTEAGIIFASELSAVSKATTLNHWNFWLGDYLRYGCNIGFTPWLETHQASPGAWMQMASHKKSAHENYFVPETLGRSIPDPEAIVETRRFVGQAVERQLVSDVPLGVFLSGGVDSSVIASCARALGNIQTFSVGFDDQRYDESAYARDVAKHLGTEHHIFIVRPADVMDIALLGKALSDPFGDSSALPTHLLCREVRQYVKAALSGDGGDELFGGYDRYRAMKLGRWLRPLAIVRPLAERGARGHPKSRYARLCRFLASAGLSAPRRYDRFVRVFDDWTLRQLIGQKISLLFPTVEEAYSMCSYDRDPVQAALACDRKRYLPDDLLTKVDRCSMLHGLEVRSPFMDHELVQFAAGLTTDQLLKGGPKRMLREAFSKDLPDFVFKRKKMGFALPIGEWFRGELKPMLRDNLFAASSFGRSHFNMKVVERLVDEHEQQRVDHSQRLYALLMLELWWQQQKQ